MPYGGAQKLRPLVPAASSSVYDVSWLFDQLAELAVADRVEVVIGFDMTQHAGGPGSIDVADLVVRAAQLPSTTMLLRQTDSFARAAEPTDCGTVCWIVARQDSTTHVDLDEVGPPSLRISIGCLNPNANVTIQDASGLASLIDAFLTLREFAFEPIRSSMHDHGAPA